MNFQRGFFRIWVVGSALFVIAVAALSYGKVTSEFERASMDFSKGSVLMLPTDCKLARGSSGADYSPIDGPWNDYTTQPVCWYKITDFRRLYPEYADISEDALSDKLYDRAGIVRRPARPWQELGIAAAIALSVPLISLMIGAALGWALSGFRTRSS